ncbi:TetR/AcrR family transcriptional regulator [Amycolatopsis sp. NBC_00345]|uniref:TetR/AcrR family transcriptional regulator n=1 Tax=Amycolatopsis sp. NBC_00345 TaxID=2975955 RepID=UPI002E2609D6
MNRDRRAAGRIADMTEVGPRRRGRPKNGAAPATEDRMLAEALHAFAVHGYQGVSVRDLNRSLGVSHNLLHQRFGSKDGVWHAAVDWGFGGLVAELAQADDATADPEVRLRTMVRTFVSFSARNPDLQRVITSEAGQQSERLDHLLETFVLPVLTAFAPLYGELVESGRLRDVPANTLYYLITSGGGAMFSQEGMTRRLFGDSPFEPAAIERHAEAVADLIIEGLRKPASAEEP